MNINVNNYNSYNKTNISNNNWQHQVDHRKGAQYRDQANPLKRYLLNSTMLKSFKYGGDSSLTLYVQKTSPGPAKQEGPTQARSHAPMAVSYWHWG